MHCKNLYLGLFVIAAACSRGSTKTNDVQSMVGNNEMQSVSIHDQSNNWHRAVGHLSSGCTGWFISKTMFVTNQHCVADTPDKLSEDGLDQYEPTKCATLSINLKFYGDVPLSDLSGIYRCKKIHLANQAHDVAIVEIEGEVDIEPLRVGAAVPGSEVLIYGHPGNQAKTLSSKHGLERCKLRDVSFPPGKGARDAHIARQGPKYEHSIEHNCDTIGGNSGSPVIEGATGRVVALHWDGYASSPWPHADVNGTEIAQVLIEDPENPGEKMPFSFKYRQGNVGIRIQDIKAFVEKLSASDPAFMEIAALFSF